eukprot:GHVL01013749.1.p1 GENE.GHVL01013749.1~~GHVL01013749.1.p1  ORF type:complete len:415 (-),score=73.34 GHVL01013749.1:124-1368(-)
MRVMSYGPCQIPTLGFVVERWQKIDKFLPENFWSINITIEKDQSNADFIWDRNRLYDELTVLLLYELINSKKLIITDICGSCTSKWSPVPLNTVEMTILVSKKLRIVSHKCMQIAESLYQKGYISYPRTETDSYNNSIDLKEILIEMSSNEKWGTYTKYLLNENGYKEPRKGCHDDKAHPPIHPVKNVNNLTGDDSRVYELICRHFLATCSPYAKGNKTTIKGDIGGEGFHSSGLMVTEQGWLTVFIYEKWTGQKQLPVFSVGEVIKPSKIMMVEGKTEPPSPLTESELIILMDKNGIGTDATMHEHIKTIQERKYAIQDGNGSLTPSNLGLALVESMQLLAESLGLLDLSKPNLRSYMENQMSDIAKAKISKNIFVNNCLEQMKQIFTAISLNAHILDVNFVKRFARRENFEL